MAPQVVSEQPPAGGPAPDLFVEYLVRGRGSWGTRLYADGRTEEWTDAGGWQPLVRVAPTEVAAFEELVRTGGYLELPATIEPTVTPEDGSQLTWTIALGGGRHRVTERDTGPHWNPVLRALDAELQRIVGEALNREADAAEARGDAGQGGDVDAGEDAEQGGHAGLGAEADRGDLAGPGTSPER